MRFSQKWFGLLLASLLLSGLVSATATVEAGLFGKKKDRDKSDMVQTYQPPPPEAAETECEPIRQKVLRLNRRPFMVKFFSLNRLRTARLKDDHKDCLLGIKQQQIEYLRHVDKPQAPSLPPLKVDE
jgi:hypothetical protein